MKKIILVGGCFDLIHHGHIVFLKEAKNLGDFLIVALESDINVQKYKGKGRPIHTQKERQEMIASLRMVDRVINLPEMKSDEDYFQLVKSISPDIIAITKDDPQKENKEKQAKHVGGTVSIVTPRISTHSTTNLIEKLGL